ncbi:MAG: DMT family transporter [Gammaproteobacteria bacterium]|nr:DMT family transporter [Gammaproteobacteria bacterium]
MKNNYFFGFVLVVTSGLIWSVGAPMIRFFEDAENYRLPFLFYRGITIFLVVIAYVYIKEGRDFLNILKRIDVWSLFGGLVLALAMFGYIYALTTTSVAVTLLMLALSPILSAFLGYLILGEGLSRTTLVNMIIVAFGVIVMVWDADKSGTLIGATYGFFVALGFAIYTITLRHNPEIPKLLTPALAGFFGLILALILILLTGESFEMPQINVGLSFMHGLVVSAGLILFGLGAKYLPSGELVLLTLFEVIAGIFWAWLPIIGINEVPDTNTIIGGAFIFLAIVIQGLYTRKQNIIPMP